MQDHRGLDPDHLLFATSMLPGVDACRAELLAQAIDDDPLQHAPLKVLAGSSVKGAMA